MVSRRTGTRTSRNQVGEYRGEFRAGSARRVRKDAVQALLHEHNRGYQPISWRRFGPVNECPDYVTGGNNSCFFDSKHTQIWEVYCLNVKAWNTFGSQTSDEYCLDVADAVEPDPPVNISYKITNDSFGESGKTVVITWQAPETADVDIGWLTLIYELQFRLSSDPEEWKEKGILREPCMELIDLPSGNYMVRVRCKSKNSGRWSKWSRPITMFIPSEKSKGTLLALNLTTGISITAIVVIGFGGAFHGKSAEENPTSPERSGLQSRCRDGQPGRAAAQKATPQAGPRMTGSGGKCPALQSSPFGSVLPLFLQGGTNRIASVAGARRHGLSAARTGGSKEGCGNGAAAAQGIAAATTLGEEARLRTRAGKARWPRPDVPPLTGTGLAGVSCVPADDWIEAGPRNASLVPNRDPIGPEGVAQRRQARGS
ncbi:PRLR protein, partial [Polypterus senegalus]